MDLQSWPILEATIFFQFRPENSKTVAYYATIKKHCFKYSNRQQFFGQYNATVFFVLLISIDHIYENVKQNRFV